MEVIIIILFGYLILEKLSEMHRDMFEMYNDLKSDLEDDE